MIFSERLKKIREDSNYSRNDLAAAINLTSAAISNYENANREPDIQTLVKIADCLNVSIDYLVGRTDADICPDEMGKIFCKDMTAGQFLSRSLDLNAQSRRLLVELLDCIETKQFISERVRK